MASNSQLPVPATRAGTSLERKSLAAVSVTLLYIKHLLTAGCFVSYWQTGVLTFKKTNAYDEDRRLGLAQPSDTSPGFLHTCSSELVAARCSIK